MNRLGVTCVMVLVLVAAVVDAAGGADGSTKFPKVTMQINGLEVDAAEAAAEDKISGETRKEQKKWIVQFVGPIQEDDKKSLTDAGCRLIDYLPDFAYLAAMDNVTRKAVADFPFISGIAHFTPKHKLNAKLREKMAMKPPDELITVHVKLEDAAQQGEVISLVKRLGGSVQDVGHDAMRIRIRMQGIEPLTRLEDVNWIDEHFEMGVVNDTTRWVIQTNIPNDLTVHAHGVRGAGQVVGIADTGMDYDMPWFHDPTGVPVGAGHRKVVGYDATYGDDYDADYPGHGTHVAGTLAGDNVLSSEAGNGNGMADKAKLFIQDLSIGGLHSVNVPSDISYLFAKAYTVGARLHSNSWGNSDNSYGPHAASTDRYAWEHRDFLAVFANGNEGPSSYTAINPATAKNVISVGASHNGESAENMAYFSSNGPTADGRIKPTVTAPGFGINSADSDGIKNSFNGGTILMSGTSMATPAVAGAAALVRQYLVDGYYPSGVSSAANALYPSSALIKALIINSAQNMTGSGTGGMIPANGQGWGRVTLGKVLHFAGESTELLVEDVQVGLLTNEAWSKQIIARSGYPFKVTLVWTDYPGVTGASKALVNDLDLTVATPEGELYRGNMFASGESFPGGSYDRLNVEEQVLIKYPAYGTYTVSVHGYNIPFGPQPFAIVVTGAPALSAKGRLILDRQRYNSGGSVQLLLADLNMNRDGNSIEQVSLNAVSSNEPGGEIVTLLETTPDSGIFRGSITLTPDGPISGNGQLTAMSGGSITAIYQDLDDGTGLGRTVTADAVVDDVPPLISALSIDSATDTQIDMSWLTDEPADTGLIFSNGLGEKDERIDKRLVLSHRLAVAGLREGVMYSLTARSTDEAGNPASSAAMAVTTAMVPPMLTVNSSEGVSTFQEMTSIFGISRDSSGVSSVTVNGAAAEYRATDGYYSIAVPLQVGGNTFSVVATDTLGNSTVSMINITRLLRADLYVQAVDGQSSGGVPRTLTITDTVCNNGPGDAAAIWVGFYLSNDQQISVGDSHIGDRFIDVIAAGSCSIGVSTFELAVSVAGGLKYLIVQADRLGNVVETDEGNNSRVGNQIDIVPLKLAKPSDFIVPATSATGNIRIDVGGSSVGEVTYLLEMKKDGGAYTVISTSKSLSVDVSLPTNGTYTFRAKATKAGYADSDYTAEASCVVTLACAVPSFLEVPAINSSGSFNVFIGLSNVPGVEYVLEMKKEGDPYRVAYQGTSQSTWISLSSSGTYTFRAKAIRSGYADSGYTAEESCVVTLACAVPSFLEVPAINSSGSLNVFIGLSNVPGVEYVLEMKKEGGPYSVVYQGTSQSTRISLSSNGIYTFRAKAIRAGYADSDYTAEASCVVALACAVPSFLEVPAINSSGSFNVFIGLSNVSGVEYVLEMKKDGGPYSVVYQGTASSTRISLSSNGIYTFRAKAIRSGYADSGYTAEASCTVMISCNLPASLRQPGLPPADYAGIQSAYDAATDGSTILVAATLISEQLRFNRAITLTVDGGRDCSFANVIGMTSLADSITIEQGTAILSNLTIY